MRTFTITAAFVAGAFASIASSPVSAQGGGGGPSCAFNQNWDSNNSSCVPNRFASSRS